MEDRRRNDDLILYKLDELKTDIGSVTAKLDDHIQSTAHVIHGNGNPGLKSTVEGLKTKITVLWGAVGVAITAIFNDYINRG